MAIVAKLLRDVDSSILFLLAIGIRFMLHTKEHHLRIRPRFEIETPYSVEALSEKIKSGLAHKNETCIGRIKHEYATIYLPEDEQHYWSPQLSLSIEETPNGSLLRGLYGPRSAVWTMFVFFYSLIGLALLIVSIIGFANRSVGVSGAILWLIPILLIVFFSLYFVSYSGQKLGRKQMITLHNFVEKSIGISFDETKSI